MSEATSVSDLERAEHLGYADSKGAKRVSVFNDGQQVNVATELVITNAIDETAYDLNAAAFSEVTNLSNDYTFDSVLLNFSTAEAKTITITGPDGTILWGGDVDTSSDNLGYNTTAKNFNLCFNQAFDGGDNITVAVTQFGSAGTMDCVLKVKQGSGGGLAGDPVLGAGDNIVGQVKITDGATVVGVDPTNMSLSADPHEEVTINAGNHYFVRNVYDFPNSDPVYFMFRTPNTATRINAFVSMTAEAEFTAQIFEDGAVSDDGTPVVALNNDRGSSNTPELAPFAAPTVTDDGTQIIKFKVGTGKDSGVNSFHHKIKAKTDSVYLFKLVSEEGAKWIDIDFYWYENS